MPDKHRLLSRELVQYDNKNDLEETADGICNMNYGFALMEPKITLCKAINGNIKASLRNNCDICGEITCMYCSSGSRKDSYKKSKEMVCILEDIRDVLGDMQAGRLKLKN